jgi:O-antigen/teichoic acid export membrane protein
MTARAGNALVLIGLISLVVFLVMFSAGEASVLLLLGGAATSALGLLLRRRGARAKPEEPPRFRALRRLLGRASTPEDEE